MPVNTSPAGRSFSWATAAAVPQAAPPPASQSAPAPAPAPAPQPSASPAVELSNQAVADMFAPSVKTADQAFAIGMRAAQAIAQNGSDTEKAAVQATLSCVDHLSKLPAPPTKEGAPPPPPNPNAAASAAALRACFQAVAAANGSPIGALIAQIGLNALTQKDINISLPQACMTGLSFAHALKDTAGTSPEEQTVAQATLGAYRSLSKLPDNARASAKTLRALMQVVSPGLSAPLGVALARVAAGALYDQDIPINAYQACEIGLNFTHAIHDTGTPEEQAKATAALQGYEAAQPQPNSAKACATVLGNFLRDEAGLGPDPAQA